MKKEDYDDEENSESNEQFIYQEEIKQDLQILTPGRIKKDIEQTVEEIKELAYICKGWSYLLLLKSFSWDKNLLKENFFNDTEKYLNQIGFEPKLRMPIDFYKEANGLCEVCFNENITIFSNICGHGFCLFCWVNHFQVSIKKENIFPRCMNSDCHCPVLLQTIQGLFSHYGEEGENLLAQLDRKILESFIKANNSYQLCRGANCNHYIKLGSQIDTEAHGKSLCLKCQDNENGLLTCEQKALLITKEEAQQADATWISENIKQCPLCEKKVEKSINGNFLDCACGHIFCFECQGEWFPEHKDFFICEALKKSAKNHSLSQQKSLSQSIQSYLLHKEGADVSQFSNIDYKKKILFNVLGVEIVESQFMQNAYQSAIQCYQKLKQIYAFLSFNELKNDKQSQFQYLLGEYQGLIENLLELLGVKLAKFLQKIQIKQIKDEQRFGHLRKQFKDLKNQIINSSGSTKTFKNKFVKQLPSLFRACLDRKSAIKTFAF